MRHLFEDLKNSLLSITNNIVFMANSGNWGDGLIGHGTREFFKDIKLEYTEVPYSTSFIPPPNTTFLYGGSGGFCKHWNHVYPIISRLKPMCEKVIILPATYGINHNYFDDVEWWSRDKYTSLIINPKASICPDMALWLKKINIEPTKERAILYRTCAEGIGIQPPKGNFDISLEGDYLSNIDTFLNFIGDYNEIYTDRLHVAIAGYLTGRKVYISKTNYFKIPDIIESWFKNEKNIVLSDRNKIKKDLLEINNPYALRFNFFKHKFNTLWKEIIK